MKASFFTIFFLVLIFTSCSFYAQNKKNDLEENLEKVTKDNSNQTLETLEESEPEQTEVYSVFNDFRIPAVENINVSDLRYDGWKTEPGMYTFRCKDKKRVRLTLWYLDKGPKKVLDSEFINVTPTMDKCHKNDILYNRATP